MKKIYTLLAILLPLTSVFAQVEGTWKMAPQAIAFGVGPTIGDFTWWSNSEADVTTRACLFDDEYVFAADGTFSNEMGDETWLEVWQGVAADECGTPVAPHDGSNAATWAYDEAAGTLTLTGVGAHIGLPKVINGAEITSPGDAAASISYPVVFSDGGNTMTADIDYGGGIWHFVLAKNTDATAVEELSIDNDLFSFYPNPASAEIQIKATEAIDQLIIRDFTGKNIMAKTNPSINETIGVSTLPSGLYLLECRSGDKVSIKKLNIQ